MPSHLLGLGWGGMIRMLYPCPHICGAETGLFLLCWVSEPSADPDNALGFCAVSLFSGCLAGSRNSQKGHTREFDGHCLDCLAGWVMAGPCWGLGKPGPVLISDVQRGQELFVGSTSLSLLPTPGGFSCCQGGRPAWIYLSVIGIRLFVDPSGRSGARAPAVLRPTSSPFPLKGT